MLIRYTKYSPRDSAKSLIKISNEILEEYSSRGFVLTLRQLYYQFVSKDLLPNTLQSYKTLGQTVSRAREAGLISWNHLVDRSRNVLAFRTYDSPNQFLDSICSQYHLDLWKGQKYRIEVWVEKEALSQVCEVAADPYGVAVFPNKGYVSTSSVWEAAHNRFLLSGHQDWIVLHLGDHDPSGIDMSRDIEDRIERFSRPYDNNTQEKPNVEVKRIALNIDQVREYNLPPNPAKETDSRHKKYQEQYGEDSWELDALDPDTIKELIQNEITHHLDSDLFRGQLKKQKRQRNKLKKLEVK